jgi:hypothetical protein
MELNGPISMAMINYWRVISCSAVAFGIKAHSGDAPVHARFMRVLRTVRKGLRFEKKVALSGPIKNAMISLVCTGDSHPPSEHRLWWCMMRIFKRDKPSTLLSAVPGFGPSPGPRVPWSSVRFRCWPIETLGTSSSLGKRWKILQQISRGCLLLVWLGCFNSFTYYTITLNHSGTLFHHWGWSMCT